MRVALDAGPLLDPPTGVGRYTAELWRGLTTRGVTVEPYAVSLRGPRDDAYARWPVPARLAQWSWRRFGWPSIDRFVGDADIVHATNFVLPVTSRPAVLTLHDLSFYRDDTFPGGQRLRALVPWSTQRAGAVVVPTEAVKREVSDRLGLAPEKIHVTPEGVAPV